MNFTQNELKILSGFLEQLSDRFSNDGCNDYELPDTLENREIVTAAMMANVHAETKEEWEKHSEYREIYIRKGKILTSNTTVLYYFQNKLKPE